MITSLNEVYENNEMYYWCNSCGDINIPNMPPMYYGEIEELPIKQRNLYENYWDEGTGNMMYVVDYKGKPAIALGYLFDEGYLSDLLNKSSVSTEDMEAFYNAVYDCGLMLSNKDELNGCDVLVGENTDVDLHELIVIVPYEKRNHIEKVATYLYDFVYKTVEELL